MTAETEPRQYRPLEYRRLRAPQRDGEIIADPPLDEVSSAVSANAKSLRECSYDFGGRSFQQLGELARQELLQTAVAYTREYRDDLRSIPTTIPSSSAAPIFISGHQPELFHPGVWAKNFCAAQLVRAANGVAVHLTVDSDTMKRPALAVPGGSIAQPTLKRIEFDKAATEVPYEERRVLDAELFRGFANRAGEQLTALMPTSMLREFWPSVVERAESGATLGESFAQARHIWEARWGVESLELPLSQTCQFESFHWFTAHLLAQLPRFWSLYNEGIAEYRRLHRIRSKTRPAPELAADDDWLEAPFWIWTTESPVRQRLFVKHRDGELLLSNRDDLQLHLPLKCELDVASTADALSSLADRGIKIRTRALSTTLWSRLLLGELFIHGIGGAKYDQLTDWLIDRFFGIQPPTFLTLSATIRLPIPREAVLPEELRRLSQQLRELTWNPDRHLKHHSSESSGCQSAASLAEEKASWIRTEPTPQVARRRFRELRRINEELQPCVANSRQAIAQQRDAIAEKLRNEKILGSREYAFCLYPEDVLREFLPQIGKVV